MLFVVEYQRPGPGWSASDLGEFEEVFNDPCLIVPANTGDLDRTAARYMQLRSWVVDYGEANGAIRASIFTFTPKTHGDSGYRQPSSRRLLETLEIELNASTLRADNERLRGVASDHWDEIVQLRARIVELEAARPDQ